MVTKAELIEQNKSLESLLKDVKTTMESKLVSFESKLSEVKSLKGDDRAAALKSLESKFADFREGIVMEIKSIEKRISTIETKTESLFNSLDDLDQRSRRNCVVIHGLSESTNEDTTESVKAFLNNQLKIEVHSFAISNAERINSANRVENRPRPIIVRFNDHRDIIKIWKTKRTLKGSKFLITESLTPGRLNIFNRAKDLFGMKNVWTMNGQIKICIDGKKFSATRMSDIDKIKPKTISNWVYICSYVSKGKLFFFFFYKFCSSFLFSC